MVDDMATSSSSAGPAAGSGPTSTASPQTDQANQEDSVLDRTPENERSIKKISEMPVDISDPFYKTGHRYFSSKNLAAPHYFEDRGHRIIANRAHPADRTAQIAVDIAKAREWKAIEVTGTEAFRREAWMKASLAGMTVTGYEPSARDDEAEPGHKRAAAPTATKEPTENAVTEIRSHVVAADFKELERDIWADGQAAALKAEQLSAIKRQEAAQKVQVAMEEMERVNREAALRFASEKVRPSVAVKEHPKLAGPYAVLGAYNAALKAQGHDEQARKTALAIMRNTLAQHIERGQYDSIKTQQVRFPQRDAQESKLQRKH
jgi:hypothetical protein